MRKHTSKAQMDNKFRVCLGSFLSEAEKSNISSFKISREESGKITLDPLIEIPANEHWIYKNPEALASLMKGMEDVKAGRVIKGKSFAKFLEGETE